jgi:hypothetical protein
VLLIGHVLHNWNDSEKRWLVRKAYEALRPGGMLLVYDAMIDEERSAHTFGLLMSLNMLLVTSGGSVYTPSTCEAWLREAGFHAVATRTLTEIDSAVVGRK